jgi:hypothetical protein
VFGRQAGRAVSTARKHDQKRSPTNSPGTMYLVTMWECDFRKAIERDEELATFVKNECHIPVAPQG